MVRILVLITLGILYVMLSFASFLYFFSSPDGLHPLIALAVGIVVTIVAIEGITRDQNPYTVEYDPAPKSK